MEQAIKKLYFEHYSIFPSECCRNGRHRGANRARLTWSRRSRCWPHGVWIVVPPLITLKAGWGCFQVVKLAFKSVFRGVSPSCFISRLFGDWIAGSGACCRARLSHTGPPKAKPAPAPDTDTDTDIDTDTDTSHSR